jgi:hypothetical protein
VTLWIETPCEPRELLLCWEAPISEADRNKWVVGKISLAPAGAVFTYYSGQEFLDLNFNRTEADLRKAGYLGYPAFDPKKGPTFTDKVIEAFMRRLPPATRADFPRYLEQFFLQKPSGFSEMFLLGATEARLPSDGFSLISPLDATARACDVLIEIAGYRHYLEVGSSVGLGQRLSLAPDPANKFDGNAVRFEFEGNLIGHVARFQAPTARHWLASGVIEAYFAKRNGTSDRPKAFAVLRYRQGPGHCAAA